MYLSFENALKYFSYCIHSSSQTFSNVKNDNINLRRTVASHGLGSLRCQ